MYEMYRGTPIVFAVVISCFAKTVLAHDHNDEVSPEEASAPIDSILWLHMFLQGAVWGILFPTGMVLGLSRSKWHVPLQVSSKE